MNRNFSVVFLVLLAIGLLGCNMHRKLHITRDDVIKFALGWDYARINDTMYASDCELSNRQYKVFLNYLKTESPEKYSICAIDTDQWKNYDGAASLSKNYFRHPAFDRYPVCCITWEGANEYCKWLTQIANKNHGKLKVTFRLPTPAEWMMLVADPDKNGLDTGYPDGFDASTGCYAFNFYVIDSVANTAEDGGYFTVNVSAYKHNRFGIYNLNGNVAEMTSDKSICKGGGWHDSFEDCSYKVSKHYTLPSAEVGFRLVAIVR